MFIYLNMFGDTPYLKIVKEALSSPSSSRSVREIAKDAKASPASASKTLRELEAKGILKKRIVGRSHLYSPNLENALCRHYKSLFNLEKIHSSRFLEECEATFKNILGIMLYGSRAKGTNDEKSDYDFLIITATRQKAHLDAHKLGLDAEANFLVFSFGDWKTHAQKNKRFYHELFTYGIALKGEKPIFEKPRRI
jgi:predicted nucleotidyltransferase